MEFQEIVSLINLMILIALPILIWRLDTKTNLELKKFDFREKEKIMTYKQMFDTFNAVVTNTEMEKWNSKSRIDLVVNLLKYAPDEIIEAYLMFWKKAKQDSLSSVDMTPFYGELLLLVRKDLGYPDTKISPKDSIEMLISD